MGATDPSTAGGAGEDSLELEYLGQMVRLLPGEELRFGRTADLVIDDNPFMHRVVGRFVFREGVWWLQNHGRTLFLELWDAHRGTVLEAGPGQQVPVTGHDFAVRFTAGPTSYELTGSREGDELRVDEDGVAVGTATIDFGTVPLSPEQHLLIVALYESRLRLGTIEGNAVVASRLGWTANKFNRKLDAVCDKFTRAGVRGLKGRPGDLAEGRRDALVAHALRVGLVSPNDLTLLRGAG